MGHTIHPGGTQLQVNERDGLCREIVNFLPHFKHVSVVLIGPEWKPSKLYTNGRMSVREVQGLYTEFVAGTRCCCNSGVMRTHTLPPSLSHTHTIVGLVVVLMDFAFLSRQV